MQILRVLVITLVSLGLASLLLCEVVVGLRSGKIAFGRYRQTCTRSKNPFGYWFLAFNLVCFAAIAIYVWWAVVVQPVI
jgi:hypothetical protein